MKFLADVPVPMSVVAWLRSHGHQGYHATEQHLETVPDLVLLQRAKGEGRVVITMDLDFSRLLALTYAFGPSVILFRIPDPHPEALMKRLEAHLPGLLEHLEQGAIAVIEPDRVRLRYLPIISPPSVS